MFIIENVTQVCVIDVINALIIEGEKEKMPYCFICYSDQDEPIAEFIYNEICRLNFSAYKAKVSLETDEKWSHRTFRKLKNSEWVIFLASRKACSSTVENPEVGDALLASKNLVPIVWDMDQSELPEWAKEVQTLDIRGSTIPELQIQVTDIANRNKQEKLDGLRILSIVILALGVLAEVT